MKPVEEIAREIVNNRNPHAMLADVHLKGDIIAALRAERERAERAEYELNRWKEVRANAPDWEKLWAEQSARAEKAEEDHGYLTRCLSDAVTRANKAEEERDRCRRDKMARLREVEEARAIAENAEARADRLAEALRSVEVWFLPEIHEGRDPMFAKVRAALAQEPKT